MCQGESHTDTCDTPTCELVCDKGDLPEASQREGVDGSNDNLLGEELQEYQHLQK